MHRLVGGQAVQEVDRSTVRYCQHSAIDCDFLEPIEDSRQIGGATLSLRYLIVRIESLEGSELDRKPSFAFRSRKSFEYAEVPFCKSRLINQ